MTVTSLIWPVMRAPPILHSPLLKHKKSRDWKQCCCHGYLLAASSVYRKPPQWTALAVPNPEPGWEGWSCLETRGGLSSTKPRLLAGERATKGSTQTQCSPCVHVAGWWVCSVYSIWPFRWGQGLLSFLMTGWLALHLHSTLAETKLILIKIAHIATIVELWYLC